MTVSETSHTYSPPVNKIIRNTLPDKIEMKHLRKTGR